MSHGPKKERDYGSHAKLNFLLPTTRIVSPADAEHARLLRKQAAQHVREVRAMWPTLHGDWTHRQWNAQARMAGRRFLSNMAKFHLANKP